MAADVGVPARLLGTHEQVRDEVKRADTKATTLLSLVGAALAGVIALTGRSVPLAASVTLWVATVPIGISVVLLLAAIRPRFSQHPAPGTWLYAAQAGPATLVQSYQDADDALVTAQDVCELARIARVKYRSIGHAVVLLVAGLAGLALALILAVL